MKVNRSSFPRPLARVTLGWMHLLPSAGSFEAAPRVVPLATALAFLRPPLPPPRHAMPRLVAGKATITRLGFLY